MNILVTGGSSGLGKALVTRVAKENANRVYFTYYSHAEEASALMNQYPNTTGIACNFKEQESVRELLMLIPEWDLDVLVNNAYSEKPQGIHFHKSKEEDFFNSFKVNILPVISITQKVLETFRRKRNGRIITVLTASLFNLPPIGYSVYTANKAYLQQLAKSWSKEYIKYGITSNCVSPDFMQTELTNETDCRVTEQLRSEHPLKALLTPEETADCIHFLIHTSNQINGVNIPINAGKNII